MAYDTLYLSPHLDDVAFSCGGQIHAAQRRGERCLVVTLHTEQPTVGELSDFALGLHGLWGLGGDAMTVRREEDRRACDELGVELRHEPLLDALYRTDAAGEALYADVGSFRESPREEDRDHHARLCETLHSLPKAGTVVSPLAVGGHVDHRLVRGAAEEIFGGELVYYEDAPYSRSRWLVAKARGPAFWRLRSRSPALTESDLEGKIRAYAAYASQLSTAFADPGKLSEEVRALSLAPGGGYRERLWHRR